MSVVSKYMFTLELDLSPTLVGSFPDGRRLDVRYTGSAKTHAGKYAADWDHDYVPFDKSKPYDGEADAVEWRGLEGEVISGTDSVLVRNDLVATFAGRMTIRATDGYLLNAQLVGAVDVHELLGEPPLTLQQFRTKPPKLAPSPLPDGDVDLVLAMSFEGATGEEKWAAEGFQQKTFFRYQRLLRSTMVASGHGTFNGGLIVSAKLDVVALRTVAEAPQE